MITFGTIVLLTFEKNISKKFPKTLDFYCIPSYNPIMWLYAQNSRNRRRGYFFAAQSKKIGLKDYENHEKF